MKIPRTHSRLVATMVLSMAGVTALSAAAQPAGAPPLPAGGGFTERFKQLDRNGDGTLTRDEIPRLFDQLDADKDGVVTPAEAAASRAQGRARGDRPAAQEEAAGGEALVRTPDIRYATTEGVEANSQSLDIYAPKDAKSAPVIVMIHGGGWRGGDKGNRAVGENLAQRYGAEGFVLVSVNYRLTPGGKHPANIQDVAKAVAWVHEHIAQHGGDPEQMFVMGHSAGAHLAALVAADDRWLKAEGKPLSILKGAVLLDTAAYDIPRYMKEFAGNREGAGMRQLYENAFGETEAAWRDASPQARVAKGKGIPPMLMFYTGRRMAATTLAPAFVAALTGAGVKAAAIDTVTLEHNEILSTASEKDHPLAQTVLRFLRGADPTTFPAQLPAGEGQATPARSEPRKADAGVSELQVAFSQDYFPGTKDRNGRFMGGTEIMRLATHGGMLFAGNGFWTDVPGTDPRPGAQILVKRGPDQPWEVERDFPGALRINAMEPITFTTDHTGKPLPASVTLLLADAGLAEGRGEGPLSVWVRNDENDRWVESRVSDKAPRAYIRAFGLHRDSQTDVDLIFAGTGAGEVYAGAYDPSAPGRIRWNPKPEYANPDFDGSAFRRCQGFCIANGKVYASISPALVERRDGPEPSWVEVFRWKPQEDRAGQGLRGITAVPALKGDHQVILGSREREGRILRIDPLDGYRVELELQSDDFLREKLGEFRGGKLVAYNRFEPGTDPRTGASIHWVTVAGFKPSDPDAAWLMMRHADARYEVFRVIDPSLIDHPQLFSTRTLEVSPWNPKEFFTGGYDGAANNRRNHNTAWIYRGSLLSEGVKGAR